MSIYPIKRLAVTADVVGDNVLVSTPGPTKRIRVLGYQLTCAVTPGSIQFQSQVSPGGAKTALSGAMPVAVGTPVSSPVTSDWEVAPILTKAGEDLTLTTAGAAQQARGWILYQETN